MLLDKTIKELIVRQALVDVHRDNLSEECLTGVILEVSYEYLYLRQFDDEGRYDGVSVVRKDDVTRVHWGGTERGAIARLVHNNGKAPARAKIAMDSLRTSVASLNAFFGHVVLFTEDLDPDFSFLGEVEEMDDEVVLLHEFGLKRSLDRRRSLVHLADVTRIDADSIYARNLIGLHE